VNPEFIGRAPHGMEWLAAAELEAAGARVSRTAHRALWFRFAELPSREALAGLRTLDDIFILMGELAALPRDKSALALLRGLSLDLDAAAAIARHYDPIDTRKFTVVGSALGKRNYGRYEMERALGSALGGTRWSFEDSRLGNAASERLSVRLHVDAGAFHRASLVSTSVASPRLSHRHVRRRAQTSRSGRAVSARRSTAGRTLARSVLRRRYDPDRSSARGLGRHHLRHGHRPRPDRERTPEREPSRLRGRSASRALRPAAVRSE
jgi:hypothetical protein